MYCIKVPILCTWSNYMVTCLKKKKAAICWQNSGFLIMLSDGDQQTNVIPADSDATQHFAISLTRCFSRSEAFSDLPCLTVIPHIPPPSNSAPSSLYFLGFLFLTTENMSSAWKRQGLETPGNVIKQGLSVTGKLFLSWAFDIMTSN